MREKIIYVAIDGVEFDNEQECMKYEGSLRANSLSKTTLFLNEQFEIMNIQTLNPEQVFYIYVDNDDDKKAIDEYFSNHWCSNPFAKDYCQYVDLSDYSGWFYYDTEKDEWKHFETEVQVYKDMENNFTKIMLDIFRQSILC